MLMRFMVRRIHKRIGSKQRNAALALSCGSWRNLKRKAGSLFNKIVLTENSHDFINFVAKRP